LEIFHAEPPVEPAAVTNVIGYWARKRSDSKWKDLAQMALEFLSMPASQLKDEAVNALECLKSWQRDSLISASHAEIKELEDMLSTICLDEPSDPGVTEGSAELYLERGGYRGAECI
jgi:hypothetical protein